MSKHNLPQVYLFDENVALDVAATPGWKRGVNSTVIESAKHGVVKWVAWEQGDKAFTYDQILRAEPPGAVFLPVDVKQGKVGLQQGYRPQAQDLTLYTQQYPNFDVANLGRKSMEIPRGFGLQGETQKETTQREVESETGGRLVSMHPLPLCCDNTACSPHFTHVSWGEVDLTKPASFPTDPFEVILKKLRFFSLQEITEMEDRLELYCDYTKSAIGTLLRREPGLLK
jgi:ADP-ribose pyrophosphatase YjhB (NUDIX family)